MPEFDPVIISTRTIDFSYAQPCTPPQFFHADHDNPQRFASPGTPRDDQWYEPLRNLAAHYLSRAVDPPPDKFGADPCGDPSKLISEPNLGQEWPHGPFGG